MNLILALWRLWLMIEIGTVGGEAPEVALDGESLTVELVVSVAGREPGQS